MIPLQEILDAFGLPAIPQGYGLQFLLQAMIGMALAVGQQEIRRELRKLYRRSIRLFYAVVILATLAAVVYALWVGDTLTQLRGQL